jgi:hypothetical protein
MLYLFVFPSRICYHIQIIPASTCFCFCFSVVVLRIDWTVLYLFRFNDPMEHFLVILNLTVMAEHRSSSAWLMWACGASRCRRKSTNSIVVDAFTELHHEPKNKWVLFLKNHVRKLQIHPCSMMFAMPAHCLVQRGIPTSSHQLCGELRGLASDRVYPPQTIPSMSHNMKCN